ncbi:MAG: RNA pseudouridine synthase, partial [Sandaracinaceae bacterium]|nr:RNA pseudouridine synthase [Sandaracinaceae bacterium]
RDLDHFARLGFAAPAIAAFDLMPQTDEVEALAILVPRDAPPPRVLDREATWIAIDKPPHEPTTPQDGRVRSLLERVQALAPELARAAPLHRLDEGTSGVCLFAIRPEHAAEVASTMQGKTYLVLCRGITRDKGTIARPLKIEGKRVEARTRYKRKAVVSGHSLVEVRIETGRTHQIRKHMASIGHPILGDERYGDRASNRHLLERHLLDRPFLHAASINVAGRAIESSLAPDLEAVLCSLGG